MSRTTGAATTMSKSAAVEEASTVTLMDEARVEEMLSEKLIDGFVLLNHACPRCVTPLVRQDPPADIIHGSAEERNSKMNRKNNHDINVPIPGVPFCVSCRAHVMKTEHDIAILQAYYHGQALAGRILIDLENNNGDDDDDDDDGNDDDGSRSNKVIKKRNKSLIDDCGDEDESTVSTQRSTVAGSAADPDGREPSPQLAAAEYGGENDEFEMTRRSAHSSFDDARPRHSVRIPQIDQGHDDEAIELKATFLTLSPPSRNNGDGDENHNVMMNAISDAESVVASVVDGYDEEEESREEKDVGTCIRQSASHSNNQSNDPSTKVMIVEARTASTNSTSDGASKVMVRGIVMKSSTNGNEDNHDRENDSAEGNDRSVEECNNNISVSQTTTTTKSRASTISSVHTNDESWPSFEERKAIATKVLSVKMLQGHKLLQQQCLKCSMPMTQLRDEVSCQVCPILKRRATKAKQQRYDQKTAEKVAAVEQERQRQAAEAMIQQQSKNTVQKKKNQFFENAKNRSLMAGFAGVGAAASTEGILFPVINNSEASNTPSTKAASSLSKQQTTVPATKIATRDPTLLLKRRELVNASEEKKEETEIVAEAETTEGPVTEIELKTRRTQTAATDSKDVSSQVNIQVGAVDASDRQKLGISTSTDGSASILDHSGTRTQKSTTRVARSTRSRVMQRTFPGSVAILGGCGTPQCADNATVGSSDSIEGVMVGTSLLARSSTRPVAPRGSVMATTATTAPALPKQYLKRYQPNKVEPYSSSESDSKSRARKGLPVRPVMGIEKVTPQVFATTTKSSKKSSGPKLSLQTSAQMINGADNKEDSDEHKEPLSPVEQQQQPTQKAEGDSDETHKEPLSPAEQPTQKAEGGRKRSSSSGEEMPSVESSLSSKFSSLHSDSTISSKTRSFFKELRYNEAHDKNVRNQPEELDSGNKPTTYFSAPESIAQPKPEEEDVIEEVQQRSEPGVNLLLPVLGAVAIGVAALVGKEAHDAKTGNEPPGDDLVVPVLGAVAIEAAALMGEEANDAKTGYDAVGEHVEESQKSALVAAWAKVPKPITTTKGNVAEFITTADDEDLLEPITTTEGEVAATSPSVEEKSEARYRDPPETGPEVRKDAEPDLAVDEEEGGGDGAVGSVPFDEVEREEISSQEGVEISLRTSRSGTETGFRVASVASSAAVVLSPKSRQADDEELPADDELEPEPEPGERTPDNAIEARDMVSEVMIGDDQSPRENNTTSGSWDSKYPEQQRLGKDQLSSRSKSFHSSPQLEVSGSVVSRSHDQSSYPEIIIQSSQPTEEEGGFGVSLDQSHPSYPESVHSQLSKKEDGALKYMPSSDHHRSQPFGSRSHSHSRSFNSQQQPIEEEGGFVASLGQNHPSYSESFHYPQSIKGDGALKYMPSSDHHRSQPSGTRSHSHSRSFHSQQSKEEDGGLRKDMASSGDHPHSQLPSTRSFLSFKMPEYVVHNNAENEKFAQKISAISSSRAASEDKGVSFEDTSSSAQRLQTFVSDDLSERKRVLRSEIAIFEKGSGQDPQTRDPIVAHSSFEQKKSDVSTSSSKISVIINDAASRRRLASREIGKRMAKGWILLNSACPNCATPLMADPSGESEICVCCGVDVSTKQSNSSDYNSLPAADESQVGFDGSVMNITPLPTNTDLTDYEAPSVPRHVPLEPSISSDRIPPILDETTADDERSVMSLASRSTNARAMWSSISRTRAVGKQHRTNVSDPPAMQGHNVRRREALDCDPEAVYVSLASRSRDSSTDAEKGKVDPILHLRRINDDKPPNRRDPVSYHETPAGRAPDPVPAEPAPELNPKQIPVATHLDARQAISVATQPDGEVATAVQAVSDSENSGVEESGPVLSEEGDRDSLSVSTMPKINEDAEEGVKENSGEAGSLAANTMPKRNEDAQEGAKENSEEAESAKPQKIPEQIPNEKSHDPEDETEVITLAIPAGFDVNNALALRQLIAAAKLGIPLNVDTDTRAEPDQQRRHAQASPGMSAISPPAQIPLSQRSAEPKEDEAEEPSFKFGQPTNARERLRITPESVISPPAHIPVGQKTAEQKEDEAKEPSFTFSQPTARERLRITPESIVRPRLRHNKVVSSGPRNPIMPEILHSTSSRRVPSDAPASPKSDDHSVRSSSTIASKSKSTRSSSSVGSAVSLKRADSMGSSQSAGSTFSQLSINKAGSQKEERSLPSGRSGGSPDSQFSNELKEQGSSHAPYDLSHYSDEEVEHHPDLEYSSSSNCKEVAKANQILSSDAGSSISASGSGLSDTSPIAPQSEKPQRRPYRVHTDYSRSSPETTIIILDDLMEEEETDQKEGNSDSDEIDSSASSAIIDALLKRIEETHAQLAAAGKEEDSAEKREKLAELLERLSAAAAAVEEMDCQSTTTTED